MKKIFFKSLILLNLCLLVFFSSAQTYVSSIIGSNTVWTAENSPYIVNADLAVFNPATLTIEKGVRVEVDPDVRFLVKGNLVVNGTADEPVVFTSTGNSWKGLEIDFSATHNNVLKLKHCEFSHAGLADLEIYPPVAAVNLVGVTRWYHVTSIEDCFFANNMVGIYSDDSYASVLNCRFSGNQTGINSRFTEIRDCIFQGNYQGVYGSTGAVSVFNSRFVDNAYGIESQELIVHGSEVSGSEVGINAPYTGNRDIKNNKIFSNKIGLKVTEGYKASTWDSCAIKNNIFCENLQYHVQVTEQAFGSSNIDLSENCWCSTDSAAIKSYIYDAYNDWNLGIAFIGPVINCDSSALEKPEKAVFSGKVWAGNEPLASGVVLFYRNGSAFPDTVITVSSGIFSTSKLAPGNYILLAIPDPSLQIEYVPTYFVNKLKGEEAHVISFSSELHDVDIHLIAYNREEGDNNLQAVFAYNDGSTDQGSHYQDNWFSASSRLASTSETEESAAINLIVYLRDYSGNIANWGLTNSSGGFTCSVAGNQWDDYQISVERIGYAVTDDYVSAEGQMFRIGQVVTGVNVMESKVLEVFPNPALTQLIIKKGNASDQGKVSVYSPSGAPALVKSFQAGNDRIVLDVEMLPPGVYFGQLETGQGREIFRFVKQ